MHWTSIGESTTRALAPHKDSWRVFVSTGVVEKLTPGRTLASTHLRPLGVIATAPSLDRAPQPPAARQATHSANHPANHAANHAANHSSNHSAKNWARFLAELRRRLDG